MRNGKPIYICQVCGVESIERMQTFPIHDVQTYSDWTIHRVQFAGGHLDLLTCKECDLLSIDDIFEGYKDRIREGLVEGFH